MVWRALPLRGWCFAALTGLGASFHTSQLALGRSDQSRPLKQRSAEDRALGRARGTFGTFWKRLRERPGHWRVKRKSGQRGYFDLHIPKTAGSSFAFDVRRVIPEGEGYNSEETCFYTTRPAMLPGDVKMAFLRNPASHVYSQFMQCKCTDWGKSHVPEKDAHLMESVTAWLRHFDGGRETSDLRCYHPYNMQTRALVCRSYGCHHHEAEPDLAEALRNLDSLFFVGLTEHYQASLCLFFARTHPGEPLPRWCDCGDEAAWKSFRPTRRITHDVPEHSLRDLSEEDLALISDLTRLDAQLYRNATARFAREAAEVERSTGTRILCEDAA